MASTTKVRRTNPFKEKLGTSQRNTKQRIKEVTNQPTNPHETSAFN